MLFLRRRKACLVSIVLTLMLAAVPSLGAEETWDWSYSPDFAGADGLNLRGSSVVINDPAVMGPDFWLRLTTSAPGLQGAAWRADKVRVATPGNGFITEFTFMLRAPLAGGGNGLAFAIQNVSNTMPGTSSGPVGGEFLCIRFDDYRSIPAVPTDSYVEVTRSGNQLIRQDLQPFGIDLHNGTPHTARIEIGAGYLNVLVDGLPVVRYFPLDLASSGILDTNGMAWIGFCAGTGTWMQYHEVLNWRFRSVDSAGGGGSKPGELKATADGAYAELDSVVVTGSSQDGFFFVESQDRASAIAVRASSGAVCPPAGTRVALSGQMRTSASGERYLDADSVIPLGQGSVAPVGMGISQLGGGPSGLQAGAAGATGPNNMGMLVRTWGELGYSFPNSTISEPGGASAMLEVPWRSGVVLDPEWLFVNVTGNVRPRKSAASAPVSRMVRARSAREINGYPIRTWDQDYYPDFSSRPSSLVLVGSAQYRVDSALDDACRLRLTDNGQSRTGCAWYNQKVALTNGLTAKLAFQVSYAKNGGADGLAFVLHNEPTGTGTISSESGTPNSIAVTFDTHLNGAPELSGNAVELRSGGSILAAVDLTPLRINLKDEYTHLAQISLVPEKRNPGWYRAIVELDGQTVLDMPVDARIALDSDGKAWIGLAGCTGTLSENHDVVYWRFAAKAAGPGDELMPWRTIVTGDQSESERLAAIELRRYLAQVIDEVPRIVTVAEWQAAPGPAVVVGTPATNSMLAGMGIEGQDLGPQGFYLANATSGTSRLVVAAGQTSEGAVNAVYGLLRELGYGFYLGSETVPDVLPTVLPTSPVVRKPVFTVRGVLPWYNFFNSPTTWDPIDHRAFVDSLIRMGANFVGFHTYDHEPFAAYEENGQMKWGARLLNTSAPTWGTNPLSARDFGYGTDKLFAQDYFGAATTHQIADANEAIRTEQDIMREALDYAKKRGVKSCIGFELFGDPIDPQYREVFLKRINKLLDQYPSVDYIWLWQAETQGAQGFRATYNLHVLPSAPKPDSPLFYYGAARRSIFNRIVERTAGEPPFFQNNEEGKVARANEGARLEQFAMLAHREMAHRQNPPKLIISGWGGDTRLLSAEYYDGLDKLLPKDVVFSSLDHIVPRTRVDSVYCELPPDRERWPIPWLENDGDQWHPQPYVHTYEPMMKYAHDGGSQGMLGIHWRTRDLEENFTYMVQYAWQPGLTAAQYFQDYARRCYSSLIANEMASIHSALDSLGYRWVNGAGQAECAPFNWGPGDPQKAEALRQLRNQAAGLLGRAGKGKARLEWLIQRMDWVLAFQDAEMAAVQARDLVNQARGTADPNQKKQLALQALNLLNQDAMGTALRNYARRVTTRGEYGVLATINTKAYVAWQGIRSEAVQLAGSNPPGTLGDWNPTPDIILPRFVGSAAAGRDLELFPVLLGGGTGWVHYRALGQDAWTSRNLEVQPEWVRRAFIPGTDVVEPGLEIGFSFSSDPTREMAYGPVVVTVMPPLQVNTQPLPDTPMTGETDLAPVVSQGPVFPVELKWNDLPDASYYKVFRDGDLVVETGVAFWPDSPSAPSGSYVVEAWRDGAMIARSQPVAFTVPSVPITEQPVVEAFSNNVSVVLRWPASKSLYVKSYRVTRSSGGGAPEAVGEVPASSSVSHTFLDSPAAGTWTYQVTPVSAAGDTGPSGSATVDFQPGQPVVPSINLPLTSAPPGVQVNGSISFGPSGATFQGGYMTMPHQDSMNLGYGMTMTFEFKADQINGMPVLLSHGRWQADGWYVQILGGQLVIRTMMGDATGPAVQTGHWYTVRFVYDGEKFRLNVDGEWIPQNPLSTLSEVPAVRNLVIGQYDVPESQFAFQGTLRNVKIYNAVVLE